MDIDEATAAVADVVDAVSGVAVVDRPFLETLCAGVLARGHVLLEDVPGTGKTLTATSLATALGLSFSRVQFTPDLLPADVTGNHVYDEDAGDFRFREGPVFANVVLADEINRAPPKTQAALLEAMEERQVTVDGTTYDLPDPFVVVATQNPIEGEGTFALPEAQRDRFTVRASMGYPDKDGAREILDRRAERTVRTPSVSPVLDADAVRDLRQAPESVRVADALRDYVVDLGYATHDDEAVEVGVSPRGIQRLFETARAHAVVAGRAYVAPEDVKRVLEPVFAHRIVLTAKANVGSVDRRDVVDRVAESVPVPAMSEVVGGDD